MGYLIIDFETVPDVTRWTKPLDKPDEFPPPHAHRIVCAGFVAISDAFEMIASGVYTGDALADSSYAMRQGPVPDSKINSLIAQSDERERELLLTLSRHIQRLTNGTGWKANAIVTYNGRNFDLPVMLARSHIHAVPMPWYFRIRDMRYRYSDRGHIDLADQLSDYGARGMQKLDTWCKLIGMPGKGGTCGADVERMVYAGELGKVARYCLDDVAQTAMLLHRFECVRGRFVLEDAFAIERRLAAQLVKAGAFILDEPEATTEAPPTITDFGEVA